VSNYEKNGNIAYINVRNIVTNHLVTFSDTFPYFEQFLKPIRLSNPSYLPLQVFSSLDTTGWMHNNVFIQAFPYFDGRHYSGHKLEMMSVARMFVAVQAALSEMPKKNKKF